MARLINQTYRKYDKICRYASFPYYYDTKTDKYVYGTTTYLDTNVPYSTYVVKKGDTLDKIALYFYNNPTMYWVVCSFNKIQDPYKELTVGMELRIPSISNLKWKH